MEKAFECFAQFDVKQDWMDVVNGVKAKKVYKFVGWSEMPNFRSEFVIGFKIRGRFLYVETKSGNERYTLNHNV